MDKIPKFGISSLSKGYEKLVSLLPEIVEFPDKALKWLSYDIRYLSPETNDTKNPKNYRPITCLTTTYKLITSILTERTCTFIENDKALPLKQKGFKRGSYVCKDQLLINKMLPKHFKSKHQNMSMAWIDYRKVFNSVSHNWMIKFLELFKKSSII